MDFQGNLFGDIATPIPEKRRRSAAVLDAIPAQWLSRHQFQIQVHHYTQVTEAQVSLRLQIEKWNGTRDLNDRLVLDVAIEHPSLFDLYHGERIYGKQTYSLGWFDENLEQWEPQSLAQRLANWQFPDKFRLLYLGHWIDVEYKRMLSGGSFYYHTELFSDTGFRSDFAFEGWKQHETPRQYARYATADLMLDHIEKNKAARLYLPQGVAIDADQLEIHDVC